MCQRIDGHRLNIFKYFPVPIFFDTGGTHFDRELIDYLNHPVKKLGELTAQDLNGPQLRAVVIAADFSLRQFQDHVGLYGWLAQGKVYRHILARLVHETEAAKAKNTEGTICLIWAVHFPPAFPMLSRPHRLLLEERLIAEANRCGVRAILAGHTHEQTRYRNPEMNFDVFCCGSSTQFVPPQSRGVNRFQILNVALNKSNEIVIDVDHYRYLRQGQQRAPRSYFYWE